MTNIGFPYYMEDSLGKQWFFTLSDQQKIQYTCRENSQWTEEKPIDGKTVRFFSSTMDNQDRICLLAYTLAKQLIYYEWDGKQWYQRLVYRVSSRFEDISWLSVLSDASHVHLLYYIENSLKRAQESFVHSYSENGRWKSKVFLHFLTDQNAMPQLITSDQSGNLVCVYTKTLRDHTQCCLIRFDNIQQIWSGPATLFQTTDRCSNFNGTVDSDGFLHMVWCEDTNQTHRLNYKKIDTKARIPDSADSGICVWESPDPIQVPCIFSGKEFHCSWIQGEKGMVSRKKPADQHWETAREIPDPEPIPYLHITKTLDGASHSVMDLGDGFPDFTWSVGNPNRSMRENRSDEKKKTQQAIHRKKQKPDAEAVSSPPDSAVLQDIRNLSKKLDRTNARMDAFQHNLYEMQDHIRQKDNSTFLMDAQVQKLSFEMEQIQRGSRRIPPVGPPVRSRTPIKNSIILEASGTLTDPGNGSSDPAADQGKTEKQEAEKQDAEKQDMEKQEAEKQDAEKQDMEKQETEKQDMEKQDMEKQETEMDTGRNLKDSRPAPDAPENENAEKEDEEIRLGNISIRINPEEEPDEIP